MTEIESADNLRGEDAMSELTQPPFDTREEYDVPANYPPRAKELTFAVAIVLNFIHRLPAGWKVQITAMDDAAEMDLQAADGTCVSTHWDWEEPAATEGGE